jgi:tetratricopeptide (TPR) repeat protein
MKRLLLSTLAVLFVTATLAQAQKMPITTTSDAARVHYVQGEHATGNVDFERARAHFDAALAADPTLAMAHVYLAVLSGGDERAEHVRQATANAAQASEAERQMVESYTANLEGDHDREGELLTTLAERYPSDPMPMFWWANTEANRGNTAEAVAAANRSLAADPTFASAYNLIGYVPALGVHRPDAPFEFELGDDPAPVVAAMARTLAEAREAAEFQPLLEAFHDAQEGRTEADQLMRLGYLDVESLAQTDSLYWSTCREVLSRLQALDLNPPPPEQAQLEDQLTDLYLCDFSVFHSIIDHWAIGQMFPVMPLHRLEEEPRRRAQVVDLTCDSDGKVAHYPRAGGVSEWLPLHKLVPGEPYYLGFFLVGAYQEILGDSHNLFGRVSEVHVYASDDEPGNFFIEKVIGGITVQDMLAQVQYFPNELNKRMSDLVKAKIEAGVVKPNEGMRILNQYTRRFEETTYCDMKVLKRD